MKHLAQKKIMANSIPEPNSGCWLWIKHVVGIGYGQCWFNGKQWQAHRLSWWCFKEDIPNGLQVCHRCDNPCCVNPDHLFIGTQRDNFNDMVAKGRRHLKWKIQRAKYGTPFWRIPTKSRGIYNQK